MFFIVKYVFLFALVSAQIYDPYDIMYPTIVSTAPVYFYHPRIGNCPTGCATNSYTNPNIGANLPNNNFAAAIGVKSIEMKLQVSTCDPLNFYTAYSNDFYYTTDNVTWTKIHGFVCPLIGDNFFKIVEKTPQNSSRLTWGIDQVNSTVYKQQYNETITVSKSYTYSFTGDNFSVVVNSDCTSNEVEYYSVSNTTPIKYKINSTFAFSSSTVQDFTVIVTLTPSGSCNVSVMISDQIVLKKYTLVNTLFYSSSAFSGYLPVIISSYQLNSTTNITVNGFLTTVPSTFDTAPLSDLDAYNLVRLGIIPYSNVYVPLYAYFGNTTFVVPPSPSYAITPTPTSPTPSLISTPNNNLASSPSPSINVSTLYNTKITIDSSAALTGVLIINNSVVTVLVDNILADVDLTGSHLIVNSTTLTVPSLEISGNNTLTLNNNSSINVTGSANFSGKLYLDGVVGSFATSNVTVIAYRDRNGTFDSVIVNNTDPCATSEPVYTKNQLIVAFTINNNCSVKSNDNLFIYYIVIPVIGSVVIVTIVVSIVVLKVKPIRKVLFPHRDKEHYVMKTVQHTSIRNNVRSSTDKFVK